MEKPPHRRSLYIVGHGIHDEGNTENLCHTSGTWKSCIANVVSGFPLRETHVIDQAAGNSLLICCCRYVFSKVPRSKFLHVLQRTPDMFKTKSFSYGKVQMHQTCSLLLCTLSPWHKIEWSNTHIPWQYYKVGSRSKRLTWNWEWECHPHPPSIWWFHNICPAKSNKPIARSS